MKKLIPLGLSVLLIFGCGSTLLGEKEKYKILYSKNFEDHKNLYITGVVDKREMTVTNDTTSSNDVPAVSLSGKKILFTKGNLGGNLYSINSDGSGVAKLLDCGCFNPSFSPDMNKIIYNEASNLYIVNSDGTNVQEIVKGLVGYAKYSPDGTKIAYIQQNQNGLSSEVKIMIMNSNGTGQQEVTKDLDVAEYSQIAFSPDGKKIAYAKIPPTGNQGYSDIYSVDISTGKITNLTNTGDAYEFNPDWSIENKIVFETGGGIDVMNGDGSGRVKVRFEGSYPKWILNNN